MKPKAYSKKATVNGMQKAVDKAMKNNRQMHEIFFENGKPLTGVDSHIYKHYMKDHVSKDLGIPIHQITPASLRDWEQNGFTKANADAWWRRPDAEEEKRSLKMLCGGSLRMDL
jgi:hypothetical protein